jgi:cyclic-di-GMP-binding protein
MPSFDVVSEVDLQEVHNAVDQANREISTRFDFRGVDARFERIEDSVKLTAEAEIQLDQMLDILRSKLVKRSVDVGVIEPQDPEHSGKLYHQMVLIKQGIETVLAKKIVKMIKDKKLKVQAAIQGEKVRVTGKKRDDLQNVMAMLRESDIEIPMQYENFRD